MADAVQGSIGHLAEPTAPEAPVLEDIRKPWPARIRPGYLAILIVLLVFPFISTGYPLTVLTEVLIFGLFAMSLDVILGYAGMPSFGHAAFFGLGAYGTAVLAAKLGQSNLAVTLSVTLALTAVLALIIGALAIRTSGVYFLMITLAFAQMVYAAATKWTPLTGGSNGLPGVRRPTIFIPGIETTDPKAFYLFVVVVFALSFFVLHRLVNSPFGRSLVGIRENEVRMRAMGYGVQRYKLAAFVVGAMFGGVAGLLWATFNSFISPPDVYWTQSGTVLLMVLLGGSGTLVGPVLGAAFFQVLELVLSSKTEHWQIVLGAVFVIFIMFVRRGLMGIWAQFLSLRRGHA
ncbi:MAG TPA: branched-chain amino acid ABC transporter permease [Chloroflexota bacterium]|nr:branched-chain amino acid ABC transporter permease [Chloroflexota bacterium]